MSIRKIVDWATAKASGQLFGQIASPFYQYSGADGNWTWACDVDIGEEEVLRNVPIATNNREIFYANEGMPVTLQKMGNNKYAVTGLSKKVHGTTNIIYISFTDLIPVVSEPQPSGFIIRKLTYGELDTYGDYGIMMYGARGRFTATGDLDYIIRSY